tara:strand:- start:174 stop:479 length:306 start_codon:yes stop_codon:yes gene_type:complete
MGQDTTYELYARSVGESDLFGFLEIEEFVFGETTQLLVDPSEERLKNEFASVKRTYVPLHSVIRIDEVDKEGISKVVESKGTNVSPFPPPLFRNNKKGDNT